MKFYISTTGIKRVTISTTNSSAKGSTVATRRITRRTFLPVVLLLSIVLPFLFVRIAFLVLESASACNSALDCIGWRLLGGSEASLLREELTRALMEAKEGHGTNDGDYRREGSTESFNVLVNEMTSNQQDIKTFAFRTKAMLSMMELKVQSAREQESVNWHLASHGVPKSLHCLCLKLAEEYAVNAMARSHLPPPEYVSRLTDPSFHHVVLLTDNVLAASVVISSTVQHSANPEKLVFHVVTDKKTYIPMNAWFAINPIKSAAVEVKGLHQYDWSHEVNVHVKEMLEIHRLIWSHYNDNLRNANFQHDGVNRRSLEALTPSCLSLLNHLRIYIPEVLLVLLLWLNEPIISSNFDHDRCVWLYGVNVFDLEAWRRVKITTNYHKWLKHNLNFGMELWQPGVHPPALLAFEGQVHPIDPSWHVGGLGYRPPQAHDIKMLSDAMVLHFSGPAKPWLDVGFPELRSLWNRHVNFSDKFIRKCRFLG